MADPFVPPEQDDPPAEPDVVLTTVLAVALAIAWLLVAVSVTLLVGGILFVRELIGEYGPARLDGRSLTLIGSFAVSLVAYRLAWLFFDRPSRRIFLSSLIAAVALLGLSIALRLLQGDITAGPDLFLAGFMGLVSGLAVWQTR